MIRVAILTVSDSATAGTRKDVSGPALKARCEDLDWRVVATSVVPDEMGPIICQLQAWVDDEDVEFVVTTGGTGVARRDVTPEATRQVLDREVPGLAELMRTEGLKQTHFAVLSRGLAGTRNQALIVNLPGSPKGAVHSLDAIAPLVPHVVQLLRGKTEH